MHGRQSMRGKIIKYDVFNAKASCNSLFDMDELEPFVDGNPYSFSKLIKFNDITRRKDYTHLAKCYSNELYSLIKR